MDKIVSDLLSPIIRHLTLGSLTAAALFWGMGLSLFHQFHPQALPGCSTGGTDLCGLIAKSDVDRQIVVGVGVLIVIFITAEAVFTRAAKVTQFLSGTRWSKRRLFVFFQDHFRERLIKRGYGSRDVSPGSVRARRINIRSLRRANRYPHGMPRTPHDDPPRLVDVPLEPTFLGNVFAALHQRILATHGLRLASCWELLLSVLPDDAMKKLVAPSSVVLVRAQIVIWAVMNCIWAVWLDNWLWRAGWVFTWLAVAYLAYRELCTAAGKYCDRLGAIVFAHRWLLYEVAKLPSPKSTADELRTGLELSGQLDRRGPLRSLKFR
jgi:hypothetical protein